MSSTTPSGPSATNAAIEELRRLVASGAIVPGDKVPPERELAARLGVSRSSIREAVRELSALGVLEARRGDGTYIAESPPDDLLAPLEFTLLGDSDAILQLADLRLLLEPYAAGAAAARITPEQLEVLEAALRQYEVEVMSGEPDANVLIKADELIHDTLIEATGNPLIAAVSRSMHSLLRRGREMTVNADPTIGDTLAELRAVVTAIRERDPLRATSAMTWHVSRAADVARQRVHAQLAETAVDGVTTG